MTTTSRASGTSRAVLKIAPGDQIPSIGLRASDGYLLNLRSFVTREPVALVFFGAQTMRGAARRAGDALAQALAAGYERLRQAGIAVVGVTCDNEQQQRDYISQHRLPYLLFSDERRSAVEILGIPMVNEGPNYNVARPVVIAVDIDGTVRSIIDRPVPDQIVETVMRAFSEPLPGPAAPAHAPEGPTRRRARAADDRSPSGEVGRQPDPATGSADPSAPARTADGDATDSHREPPPTQRGPSPTEPPVPGR